MMRYFCRGSWARWNVRFLPSNSRFNDAGHLRFHSLTLYFCYGLMDCAASMLTTLLSDQDRRIYSMCSRPVEKCLWSTAYSHVATQTGLAAFNMVDSETGTSVG